MESILGFWDRCTEACSSCTSCTTLVIPETHRLARFGKKIRGKSVHEKTIDFSMSHGPTWLAPMLAHLMDWEQMGNLLQVQRKRRLKQ